MSFMMYSPDGQAVCVEHQLIVCGRCCVDFTGPEFQQDDAEDSEDERVFVLGQGVNRFVPQWDEQVHGPANVLNIKNIIPARSVLVQSHNDIKRFRLVLVTDSAYAVECMCKHWQNWVVSDRRKALKNKQGKVIANSDLLLAIEAEVEKLSRVGVQVTYYCVPRELNKDADALARAGATA